MLNVSIKPKAPPGTAHGHARQIRHADSNPSNSVHSPPTPSGSVDNVSVIVLNLATVWFCAWAASPHCHGHKCFHLHLEWLLNACGTS